jgi:ABC-type bacteriocin/lantibiotic exporter with double-glycine peptidase domain
VRFQSNRSSCGPAALHNALSALGIERTEDELIKLCSQKPSGTPTSGLLRALKAINSAESPTVGEALYWRNAGEAVRGLWWFITQKGRPLILCVDNWDHWVACTGYLGARFCVMDSADNRLALYYTTEELLRRWDKGGRFYAVVV